MPENKSINHQVADVIVDVCGRLRLKTGWAEGMIIANALKDEGLLATEKRTRGALSRARAMGK